MNTIRSIRWWLALPLAALFYLGANVLPHVMDVVFGISH